MTFTIHIGFAKRIVKLMAVVIIFPLVSVSAQVQVYGSGDSKVQSFTSSGTTNGAATNGTLRLFSIMGQPMVSSDLALTKAQAGILTGANNGVLVADKIAPKITVSGQPTILTKGAGNANTFTLTVSDNISVASAKMNYKKIMSASTTFAEINLIKGSSLNSYSVGIQDTWYDEMGLEYYFTATDRAGNLKRDPASGSYFAFLKDPNVVLPKSRYSIGDKISNYRIVALPYVSDSGENISDVFGVSTGMPAFSSANDIWRLGTYETSSQKFLEYPLTLTTFLRGKGYWFILNKAVDQISFGPKTSPSNTRSSLFSIPLKTGWNMIGNPYPSQIKWSDVQQFQGNPQVGDLSTWDGGWSLVTDWSSFQGGFVNSAADGNLVIPFAGQTKTGGKITNSPLGPDLSNAEWQIDLHVFQPKAFNKLGRFGMINSTQVGEEYKSYNPPPVENSPEINFTKAKLCRSIVPNGERGSWAFEVLGEVNADTEIWWSNDLGQGEEVLFLLDNAAKKFVDMREVNSYKFTLENSHSFKIFFGSNEKELLTDEIIISKPYPNPSIDHRNSFMIGLPESTSLFTTEVELFESNGSVVSTLQTALNAGIQTIDWKLGDDLKQGLYYYRIKIQADRFSKIETGKIIIQ